MISRQSWGNRSGTIGNLIVLFKQIERAKGGEAYIAPVDVVFDEDNVPQPDVIWLAPDSRCKSVDGKRLSGPPDLIAEVLSPSTGRLDKREKFRLYERFGVREYWIVDPLNQLVEVWLHNGKSFDLIDVFAAGETFTSALVGEVDTKLIFGL